MMVRHWIGSMVGVTLALIGYGRSAAACGACVCDNLGSQSLVTLVRDVPLNLELPLRPLATALPPSLERVSDGETVAADVFAVEGEPYWLLKVTRDLEPNTEYRVMRDGRIEAQFTTGATRDDAAPKLDAITSQPGSTGALCDAVTGARVALTGASDGDRLDVWVELEVDVMGTTQMLYGRYDFGELAFGHSEMGCLGDNETPWVRDGEQYTLRARLRDLGGNVSEWRTAVATIATTQPGGCGGGVPPFGGAAGSTTNPPIGGAAASGTDPDPDGGMNDGTSGADAHTSKGCGCAVPTGTVPSGFGVSLGLALLFSRRLRRGLPRSEAPPPQRQVASRRASRSRA